jgi:hypothetical protein
MPIRDQHWKPTSSESSPDSHLANVLAFPGESAVDHDMITRWIKLADQALGNDLNAQKNA